MPEIELDSVEPTQEETAKNEIRNESEETAPESQEPGQETEELQADGVLKKKRGRPRKADQASELMATIAKQSEQIGALQGSLSNVLSRMDEITKVRDVSPQTEKSVDEFQPPTDRAH